TTLATAGTAALAGGDDKAAPKSAPPHPLDPLSAAELTAAVQLLRKERKLAASYRFVSCTLDEPARKTVRESRSVPRRAFVVLLDRATGTGYEAVVDLTGKSVERFDALPKGIQPAIMIDEFGEAEEA